MHNSQQMYGWYRYTRGYQILGVIIALISVVIFAFHSLSVSALTTVPTKMNFQGRLTDSTGNIKPNGTYNMKFKLYTVASAGTAVWSEDRLVSASQGVTVTNGLFSVQLGSVTSLPANLFASGALYLEVELPSPATATSASPTWSEGPMSPRNQMATSAYAYNAETIDGIDSANLAQLDQNNTFSGNNIFTGTIQGNSSLTLGTVAAQGSLIVNDGNGQTATIRVADTAGNYVYTLPVTTANDTFCLQTLANCGGAGGGDVYLANANTFTNINTIAKTSATAFRIQSDAGAATLLSADTSAMTVAVNGDVSLAAGKSLTVTGGITSTRPASPTEGMVYYDTSTKQLLTYSNGKWQADQSDAILVAAANSSQADKDSADYIADGDNVLGAGTIDGDQVQINNALTAAAGKKVVLLAGTYVADATILIPNNTTLAGVGQGTVIELADIDVTDNLIENLTQGTGADITIRDLKLDGRKDLNTAGSQTGVLMYGVGDDGLGSKSNGVSIENALITRFNTRAVNIDAFGSTGNHTITDSIIRDNQNGILLQTAINSVISGNIFQTNKVTSLSVISNSMSNTIEGNIFDGNGQVGIGDAALVIGSNNNTITGNTFSNGLDSYGVKIAFGSNNTFSSNSIIKNDKGGVYLDNASGNVISGNTMTNNGGTGVNYAIRLFGADGNNITGNSISDDSASAWNYAIYIENSTSDTNYLADNTLGGGSINDAGTGTLYGGQVDASGNFTIQPAGSINLNKNTTVSAGSLTLGNATTAGSLIVSDGSSNTATIAVANLAGNYTYTIPVTTANDTFCLQALANCGGGGGVNSVGALDGGTANANGATISGSTIYLQSASATNAGLVNTTTQTFAGDKTFSGTLTASSSVSVAGALSVNDVTVAAGKSLTVTGGITSTRPASPTEGMVYYDTTTKQLLTYANGKWMADQSDAILVAAGNSSQADKDSADYIADGDNVAGAGTIDGDQVQINAALTAASGKKVVLLAGTYVADATILIPNNTILAGVGQGTVIELADIDVTDNLIENSDQTTGTGVTIKDMKLDGRKDLNTAGTQYGVYFSNMGGGSGSGARKGSVLSGINMTRMRSDGFYLTSSNNNTLASNTAQSNGGNGFYTNSSSNNTFTSNTSQANNYGFYLSASTNNTFTGNFSQGNTWHGFYMQFSSNDNTFTGNTSQGNNIGFYINGTGNTFTGNTAQGNTAGFYLSNSISNTLSGNTVRTNSSYGFWLVTSSDNTIESNTVSDSGGSTGNNAIFLDGSDSNNISGNTVTDSSATTTNFAINVSNATSDNNFLTSNTLGGGSVNDLGTGTIYSGQLNANGYFVFSKASARLGIGQTAPAYALDVTGDINSTTGFRFNGTAGASITCSGGQFLQNQVVQGGIVTGGTCATAGGGGSYVTLQATTPGTADTGNINVTGTVIGAILQAGTSVKSSLFDTASAGALAIGTTSATAINLNQSTTVLAGKTLTVGTGTNGIILSDTGLSLVGTARGTRTITLAAEYPSATFIGDGGGDNTGSLSSDFCSSSSILNINAAVCPLAADEHNYYAWTTTQATPQDYDIYVRYMMPSDYDTGSMTNLKLTAMGTTGAGEIASLSMYKGSATACGSTVDAITANATWATATVASPLGACTVNAGDMVTFKVKLTATTNNTARAGQISFQYRSKF